MSDDVQRDEPGAALLNAATIATSEWMRRVTVKAAERAGPVPAGLSLAIDEIVASASSTLLDRLRRLLATDVDEQATNPLSLFRDAVAGPNELLVSYGVPVPPADPFGAERFPDDVHRLGPATWSDIDPSLHGPGIEWGAAKAMTVLRRRREEGLR